MAALKEKSISLLSSTTVALNATGQTTLYTVPVGKRCVVTHAVLIAGADASTSALTIGSSGALTDFLGTQTLTGINAQYDVAIMQPVPNATPVLCKSYSAGTIIQVDVTTGAGGATNTLNLYGFIY